MLPATQFEPFASKNFIDLPELSNDSPDVWSGFRFEAEPSDGLLRLDTLPQSKLLPFRSDILKLDISDNPSFGLESTTQSLIATPSSEEDEKNTVSKKAIDEDEDDFWKTPNLLASVQENKLISWDHFTKENHEEPSCTFISEADPTVFDSLLQKILPKSHNEQTRYARPDILVSALFDLGLGHSSALFTWNKQSQRFDTTVENYTQSGLSQDSLQHVVDQFLDAGAQFNRLRQFGRLQETQSPIRIALQTAVQRVVDVIEGVIESTRHSTKTLLQLLDTFEVSFFLLSAFDQLVMETRSIRDDVDLVAKIVRFADGSILHQLRFETLMHVVISRIVETCLQRINVDVGLTSQPSVLCLDGQKLMSTLTSASTFQTYTSIVHTLQVLRANQHEVPLMLRQQPDGCKLSVGYTFEDISGLQQQASGYELKLQDRVIANGTIDSKKHDIDLSRQEMSKFIADDDQPFKFQADLFQTRPPQSSGIIPVLMDVSDPVEDRIATVLSWNGDQQPLNPLISPFQAIDLSINPLINAQHRLLSYSALELLFNHYKLTSHVDLLGRFQLMTDGTFSSKLSTALFDPDQLSGEGRLVMQGKTGLRLQNRETWPPATSELRLALMGILSECMSAIREDALTDSISFAIKDLANEDLERCSDLDSIYALDFLRLNYKPPNPCLEAVVTTDSFEKYDAIFNQLLRLLRMKAIAQSVLRRGSSGKLSGNGTITGEHKFRVEIQQFVAALGEYYQTVVIRTTWHAFETKLEHISHKLGTKDYAGTLKLTSGPDDLQTLHEKVLDTIMRGLLLKRRQSEAKGIIDRLFEVILRFTATSTAKPTYSMRYESPYTRRDNDVTTKSTIVRLHQDFQMHMKALVRWLKVEAGRSADGEGAEMFEQLLLKLNWNGYWSR